MKSAKRIIRAIWYWCSGYTWAASMIFSEQDEQRPIFTKGAN